MAGWCEPAYRHAVQTLLQLQQRMLSTAKEAADQASIQSLIAKAQISLFSNVVRIFVLARPQSNRLQSTLDGSSALETIDKVSSSTACNVTDFDPPTVIGETNQVRVIDDNNTDDSKRPKQPRGRMKIVL